MEPILETCQAILDLDALAADDDLLERLVAESEQVQAFVPDCIAMSVTLVEHGVTFTFLAASHASIMSSLSLPLAEGGVVDLYATTPHAFGEHHQRLAEVLGASAAGAVSDADLGFRTHDAARRAPEVLRETVTVEVATGMLAGLLDIEVDDAHVRLTRSATRVGIAEPVLARAVTDLVRGDTGAP
ncbi:hypothetical protein GCM10009795_061610 [Nocardioides hankookensis]|uniref:ANTAR domain-containing protein n=1 Tax=Nocardioides hankookensis TaxID=443157 RepID=A0ABW1LMH4_9ACTN